ncbi:MAG: hypothetical protein ACPIOQ_63105, partial [Promethearchaeia archaeon]
QDEGKEGPFGGPFERLKAVRRKKKDFELPDSRGGKQARGEKDAYGKRSGFAPDCPGGSTGDEPSARLPRG